MKPHQPSIPAPVGAPSTDAATPPAPAAARSGGAFVRLLGSAVIMQALLSGASLLVGLILIRRTSDLQYGYYVLLTTAVLLMVTLQGSFIQPQLVTRMYSADAAGRADLIGGLYRDQRRLWPLLSAATALVAGVLWMLHIIGSATALVVLAAACAVTAALYREFFRMVLLGHRRPIDVLRADSVYVALLVAGALAATLTRAPAAIAGLTMAGAAVVGGVLCAAGLWRFEPWNIRGAPGILRAITPLGLWSVLGAAVHWFVSQGYSYIVAAMLNVPAVAALAATRLTIMPINLLSTGVGTMMLPTTAAWLNAHGPMAVMRRLGAFAAVLVALALCYFVVLWFARDWVFTYVFKKHVLQRDALLLLWFGVAIMMILRDQIIYLLIVRHRFRHLTQWATVNAVVAAGVTYAGIRHFGITGVLWGLLTVEFLNVVGLIALSSLEVRGRLTS